MTVFARTLLGCLALAAVYFAGGMLARLLALPPTMVMPVWPPSGIALVALTLFGWRYWPGIVLGSTLFNALIYAEASTAMAWLAAALIGFGAAAQALFGWWFLQRTGGASVAPQSRRLLFKQIAFAGPIACLISAGWGSSALILLGQLPAAMGPEAALTWWLGDTIGVITLLPLLYVWQRSGKQLSRRRRWTLSASMLLLVTLVALLGLHWRDRELAQWQSEQQLVHSRIYHRFEQQQNSIQQSLMMMRALFASSETVTRSEFQHFAREQLQFVDSIATLEWVPHVHSEQRTGFEQLQRQSEPAFEIRQQSGSVVISASPRQEYFPVTFLEPTDGKRAMLGLDLLADPDQAEFVRRLQHSRRFQVSEPLQRLDADASRRIVLAGLPHPADSDGGNGKVLQGLLVAAVDVEAMLRQALAEEPQSGLVAQIWLEDADGHSQTLLQWPSDHAPANAIASQTSFNRQFGDRRWQLQIGTDRALTPAPITAWIVLALGLLLSALLGVYLLSSSHYTARVETEVAERTRELLIARDQALAASQAKSQFLASMSHEIRTPLTAIMGYTELLVDDSKTPTALKPSLHVVLDSSRTLLTLINDVLDLAKIESGHMKLELQSCSVLAVVQDVVRLLQPRAEQKQLLLLTDYRFPLPAQVLTDPLRLRQVLLNLLGNAIKFTDVGQIQLQLSAELQATPRVGHSEASFATEESGAAFGVSNEANRDVSNQNTRNQDIPNHDIRKPEAAAQWVRYRIAISDTGIGIDPAHQQRVFEPFEQAEQASGRRFGGTGLGLAISRQLTRLLGGDIRVHSVPGQGSTFILEFSAEWLDEQWLVSEFERGPLLEPQTARPHFAGHVLVAEDNTVNAKLATQLLQSCGAQVDIAADGLIALSMLEQARQTGTPYDLVFMDMQMPRMDGYEAVQKLRAAGFRQPVIALTANAMSGDRERCLAAGCDAFASKPFQRSEIEALLRQFLRLKPYD